MRETNESIRGAFGEAQPEIDPDKEFLEGVLTDMLSELDEAGKRTERMLREENERLMKETILEAFPFLR